jgi:hypothetical protein
VTRRCCPRRWRFALRSPWLWWFAASSVACGRTGLEVPFEDGDGPGGASRAGSGTAVGGVGGWGGSGGAADGGAGLGGSGGGAGSGAGSSGAAGSDHVLGCNGVPVSPPSTPCERLEYGGDAGVESPNSVSLVPIRSDGRCVSVVTARVESGVQELAALTFMPWQHWPRSHPLGPLTKIPLSHEPSPRFTVAPSDGDRLALAWQRPDGVLRFAWDVSPESFGGTYSSVDGAESSLASSTSTIGHLLLVSDATSLSSRTWASPPSNSYSNHQGACADGELAGDVEPFGDGFLIASSTGGANTQSHGCPNYPDLGGPPTRLMVSNLSEICCSSLVSQWEAGGVVTRVRTAPHPYGIWVVWRTDDGVAPVLRRARVERDSPAPIYYETIGEPHSVPGVFEAVIFGSRLAVAWVDSFAGVDQLRVTMIADDGTTEDFTPQLGLPRALEDLSVVAGPEGTGLLVGFGNGQLRRLDCRPAF